MLTRLWPPAWGAVMLAAGLAAGLPAAAADMPCQVNRYTLPVKMVGQRAIATVVINGTTVPMVVDSGAFFSFLTPAAAAQLQLPLRPAPSRLRVRGLVGEVDVNLTTVKQLQLLGGEVPDVDFVVGGNEPGAGALGLLGRNILALTDIEFDLAHGQIHLMFPRGECGSTNMAYWAGEQPVVKVPLRLDVDRRRPAIKATVMLNGTKVPALLDTGARTLVSLSAAQRAGVPQEKMRRAGQVYGVGVGTAKAWSAPFDRFELGGESVSNVRLDVADVDDDEFQMLLGIDWFLAHRIYVARGQRQMYFTYNGGPIFADNGPPAGEAAAAGRAPADAAPALPDAAAYARRGAAHAARKDFTRAVADLDQACAQAPEVAEHRLRRGEALLWLERPRDALQDFDEALRLDPTLAEARWQRAWVRGSLGLSADALDDLQALDRLAPAQADVRFDMAELYGELGQPERALRQWTLWIDAHGSEIRLPEALKARCTLWRKLGQEPAQAQADCERAARLLR